MTKGKFITLEGIDGVGKTTQLKLIKQKINLSTQNFVFTREPGGTSLGEKIRSIILNEKINNETETLLIFAARKEHLFEVIEPSLVRGDWVISDRFSDASYAYQGGGKKIDLKKIEILENWVHESLQPDLTIILDMEIEKAFERIKRNKKLDKFEIEKIEFFLDVREQYLNRASKYPNRIKIVNADNDINSVNFKIFDLIKNIEGF